jgi:hypothetical protein
MSHGLTCNEASVCNQCIFAELPCIHRECTNSYEGKRELCTDPRCHYVHRDSIPHHDGEARWIILPGNLPEYLCRDRNSDWTASDAVHYLGMSEDGMTNAALDEIEEEALNDIQEDVRNGDARCDKYYEPCDCAFEDDSRVSGV